MLMFQSHAGSIEAGTGMISTSSPGSFQSHAGSIEAGPKDWAPLMLWVFQSHAGSIEAADNPKDIDFVDEVSIPRWFD